MSIKRYYGKAGPVFWPTCDGCGKVLPPETSWMGAKDAMTEAGWQFIYEHELGWTHLCPLCAEEEEE